MSELILSERGLDLFYAIDEGKESMVLEDQKSVVMENIRSQKNKSQVLSLAVVGSDIVLNGWSGANVFEPFTIVEEYNAEWVKPPKISDCSEVARLQREQSMTYRQLAEHFNESTSEIYRSLRKAASGKISEVRV